MTLADYPQDGEAQIAETKQGGWRLIVPRTRLVGKQAELFPNWQYFAFASNRTEPLLLVEAEYREHTVVELAIRDLKDQALETRSRASARSPPSPDPLRAATRQRTAAPPKTASRPNPKTSPNQPPNHSTSLNAATRPPHHLS